MTAPSKHAHRLLFAYGQRLLAAERSGACAADPMIALREMAEAQRDVGEYVGRLEERVRQLESWGHGGAHRVKPFPAEREPDETERASEPPDEPRPDALEVDPFEWHSVASGHGGRHGRGV